MKYVIDAGFFLAGMDPSQIDGDCYITPEIREEVSKGFPGRKMEYLLDSGRISVLSPSEKSVEKVMTVAHETGDSVRLSKADISLLALALELRATILSDDYSVQNIASVLGIKYAGIGEKGIERVWKWKYRCTGCGRTFESWHDHCPVCGHPLKTVPENHR